MTHQAANPESDPLESAMRALCAIGNTAPRSHYTKLETGVIHHLELQSTDSQAEISVNGQAENRTPIVLLHGAGGGAANWYRLFAPLSLNHRVLAPDLPGFGLSDPITLEPPLGRQTAHIVARWLDAHGLDRVHLIGTSFGGLAALRFAEHFPARVERLAVIDPAGAGPEVTRLAGLAHSMFAPLILSPSRRGTRWVLRNLLVRRRLDRREEAALVEYLYQSAKRAGPRFMVHALRRFTERGSQAEQPSAAELARVEARTLVVWGRRDKFFPASHATALRQRLPDARDVLLDSGHSPNWEAPDLLVDALRDFLKD
ncbi:MAG: alpha/beta fold hydrolase [Longimicrobiales bacterium]